jgi:hypothetical protein
MSSIGGPSNTPWQDAYSVTGALLAGKKDETQMHPGTLCVQAPMVLPYGRMFLRQGCGHGHPHRLVLAVIPHDVKGLLACFWASGGEKGQDPTACGLTFVIVMWKE